MQAIPTSADQAPASVSQLFSYPFRIFFLSMTVLTLVAIPVWVLEV
ncbi:MAG TPA: NnrS family protein, partial [Marinobacter sp.]|nr:NnrS family protein [Marinobacter sp.]